VFILYNIAISNEKKEVLLYRKPH